MLPTESEAEAQLRRLRIGEPDLEPLVGALRSIRARGDWAASFEHATEVVRRAIGEVESSAPLPRPVESLRGVDRGRFWTLVFAATSDAVHRWHHSRGIPDDVSWATLADLSRHVAQYRRRHDGETGLDTEWWLTLHWRGALYELGRLQFNLYALKTGPGGPLFWYADAELASLPAEFQVGAPALGVHVPVGAQLDAAECDASFRRAASFFPTYFPTETPRLATCTSWLLDAHLADYLPADSNIVRFQQRFTIVPGALEPYTEIFNWVFDRIPESLDELQPRSRLEHAVVDHVRAGHSWQLRTGWLRLG